MAEFDTPEDARAYMRRSRNWGRWHDHANLGAVSMATAEHASRAAGLVATGEVVSLARSTLPKPPDGAGDGGDGYRIETHTRPGGGHAVVDRLSVGCHGLDWTHLDALGHVWDDDGMWDGRRPEEQLTDTGLRWGAIDAWKNGIVNRGVLLDVPRYRGRAYVEIDQPVHGHELEAIAAAQGVSVQPGDTLVVHSGREACEREEGVPYGWVGGKPPKGASGNVRRPGLDISCLKFIRETDCALLVWDMMDALPSRLGVPWPVHSVLYLYGVGLIDNASLERLAAACTRHGRYDFLFIVAPLALTGATGSPVNPLAVF